MDPIPKREIQFSDPSGRLAIQAIGVSHVTEVRRIAQNAFPVVWTEQDFIYFLENDSGVCLGLFDNGKLVSYFLALLAQGDLDIVSIATDSTLRRQGFAKLLLTEVDKDLRIKRFYLEVEDSNAAAIKLYESMGFKRYGLRKKYYQGVRDAVLMMKERAP